MPTAVVDPFVVWERKIVSRPVLPNDRGDWVTYSVEADIAHHGGTIYVGSPDNYVYAFVAATGEELWRFNSQGAIRGGIAVDKEGEVLFFGTDNNGFFAVDTNDGTEVWHWPDKDNDAGDFPSVPTLVEEVVIAGSSEGRIFAWDQDDGDRLEWAFPPLDEDPLDEPFAHAGYAFDNDFYIGNEDGRVYVVDVANGRHGARTTQPRELPYLSDQGCNRPMRRIPEDANCDESDFEEISSEIAKHDDGIVFGSNADELYLRPVPTGVIEWVYEAQGNILGDIAVEDNLIIFAEHGGTIVAIDTDESRNLKSADDDKGQLHQRMKAEWTESTEQEVQVVSGPIIHDDMAYWIDRRGTLYGYDAQAGREQFQFSLWTGVCRRCSSKPVVHGNLLFAATAEGMLRAVRLPD